MYTLTYYNICGRKLKSRFQQVLIFSHHKWYSIRQEAYVLLYPKLLRGFTHGYFIRSHAWQLGLLLMTSIFVFSVIIRLRRSFHNNFTLAMFIGYEFCFLSLNVDLLVNYKLALSARVYSKIVFYILLGMIFFVLLKSLALGFHELKGIWKSCFPNKIMPKDKKSSHYQ